MSFKIKVASGIITLLTTGGQTIDGVASGSVVLQNYQSVEVRSNGTNWDVVNANFFRMLNGTYITLNAAFQLGIG